MAGMEGREKGGCKQQPWRVEKKRRVAKNAGARENGHRVLAGHLRALPIIIPLWFSLKEPLKFKEPGVESVESVDEI